MTDSKLSRISSAGRSSSAAVADAPAGSADICGNRRVAAIVATRLDPDGESGTMLVLIVSVGILLALVVTLTVMDRRERRTRELIALEESGMSTPAVTTTPPAAVGTRPWLSVSRTLG